MYTSVTNKITCDSTDLQSNYDDWAHGFDENFFIFDLVCLDACVFTLIHMYWSATSVYLAQLNITSKVVLL
jgi:hypothetical protein